MKRTIIILAIINAALYAGCKKDNSTYNMTPDAAAKGSITTINTSGNAGIAKSESASITYRMVPMLPPNTLIQWHSGYVTVGEITFDGNSSAGNAMLHEHDMTVVNKQIDLLPAASNGTVVALGTINLPFCTYKEPTFGVTLNAIFPPGNPNVNPTSALYLQGNYMLNDNKNMQIQVIINEAVGLKIIANPVSLLINQLSYNAMLTVSLDQITAGITPEMLAKAVAIDNNIIVISASSNQALYQVMLSNLSKSLLGFQFIGNPQPPVVATSAPSATM